MVGVAGADVADGTGDLVTVGVTGVLVARGVKPVVGVLVGNGVLLGVGVGDFLGVLLGIGVSVGVPVLVGSGVLVGGSGVLVAVPVGVGVGVSDGKGVGVGVQVTTPLWTEYSHNSQPFSNQRHNPKSSAWTLGKDPTPGAPSKSNRRA